MLIVPCVAMGLRSKTGRMVEARDHGNCEVVSLGRLLAADS